MKYFRAQSDYMKYFRAQSDYMKYFLAQSLYFDVFTVSYNMYISFPSIHCLKSHFFRLTVSKSSVIYHVSLTGFVIDHKENVSLVNDKIVYD